MLTDKKWEDKYIALNAVAKTSAIGNIDYNADKEAVKLYIEHHVKPNLMKFPNLENRINFLIKNDYYEKSIIEKYSMPEIKNLNDYVYSFNHSFPSFMGAVKFFNVYCLKTFDNAQYLENYEDRVLMNALFLGNGNFLRAKSILESIITGCFQPATPTFLNAGKKQRGEYVSCYLMRIEDNMESIAFAISSSLQLSKRGGGVALCLTNLREFGAPIKKNQNQSTGIVPVMKLLEDAFTYANQLGQRQGSGAVYLNVHHPEIMTFLDTKRENADEKIRIKSLSLGIIIPDITFELAKSDEKMALFSPYDVQVVYQKPFSDISITKEYQNLINNDKIKKTYISARKLFSVIAKIHFESGYPYIMFDDTTNNNHAHPGRIVMSNLCSEITQVSSPSKLNVNLQYEKLGEDICCNLGSVNIAKIMESGTQFEVTISNAIRSLDHVSRNSDLSYVPTIEFGNEKNHALGLGAMNLHGFLATNSIYYDSPEAIDFTNMFFYTMAYYAFKTSNQMAKENGKPFVGFEKTKFADGSYFDKYTKCLKEYWQPKTDRVKQLFEAYGIVIPSQNDWINLVANIKKNGIANAYLMAIAPTGSISYLSSCTPSLQPVVDLVETRKQGKLGRIYFPAYNLNEKTKKYYENNAYKMGPIPIINIVAAAQQHIDQAISLTFFVDAKTTTRELNKAYIYAFKKRCKTIYYVRVRQEIIDGSESYQEDCQNCVI